MADVSIEKPKIVNPNLYGEVVAYEKAGANFEKNDLLTLTSGQIDRTPDNATSIFAMAKQEKQGSENAEVTVYPLLPGAILEMNIYSTDANNKKSKVSYIGGEYGVKFVNNAHVVDIDNTANTVFKILEFDHTNPIGTGYHRCKALVLD